MAYRPGLATWIESHPIGLGCLELDAEQFYKGCEGQLRSLAEAYPLVLHGSGLSLGTPGPLDQEELGLFSAVVRLTDPLWVSEHLGFRRTAEVDLAHPSPVPLTGDTLASFVEHCREVVERCRKPLLIENIAYHLQIPGAMSEPEFLNRLCDEVGCGLLVDLTALAVNGHTHGFDPRGWLDAIEHRWITQVHIGAYDRDGGRWSDSHAARVPEDIWELARHVIKSAPVRAVILERDGSFPHASELRDELRRIAGLSGDGPRSLPRPGRAVRSAQR